MMNLIRGRWSKKYINCPEDKRDYDIMKRGYMQSHEILAREYCEKFNVPDLSEEEKKEIQDFWAKYGVKIYDYSWHKMYYHVTGIHDPRFIPDMIVGLVLYEYYNDATYESTWRDKNMFDRLCPAVPFPETYGKCIRNRFYIHGVGYINRDEDGIKRFSSIIFGILKEKSNRNIIIKNTRETGFGRGVIKYTIACEEDILNALKEWTGCSNFIIQECVKQHKGLAAFNESSTNMMRICSWRHGNEVEILFGAVRAGIPGAITDVSFVEGVEMVRVIGITSEGCFSNKMLDQNGCLVKTLPENIKVPAWDEIVRIIKENHLLIDNFDIIGWDFTVDENGEPRCFEWNIQWPGTVLYQYVNGPLYGDKTEKILAFLLEKNNQDNYIPYYMRVKDDK